MTRFARSCPKPNPGIVHLGPGAFFRAFNAVYTHEAMAASGGDWGIIAVSLKSANARDQLLPQDCVYTSVTLSENAQRDEVIESIVDVRVAPEDTQAVIDTMAAPEIRIVSLTITEKGYGYDAATGGLDASHPDVAHDLGQETAPRSAVGLIVAALEKRRVAGVAPFTVLSCDNLPSNGQVARRVVLEFARKTDAELAAWIETEVPFPSTMVDRITPATTSESVAELRSRTGYEDPASVSHEAFRQWVIEDKFANGRPEWERVGAQFVDDVAKHEHMKLRCLNGTHSALAYLGYLAGFETVAEAVADGDYASLCKKLWKNEIIPVVPQPEGVDISAYCDQLLARYMDSSIKHRLWQIAMDGSQKLPQRILSTISDHAAEDRMPSGLCLAVAAWMRYAAGEDENGSVIDVRDPHADRLRGASLTDFLAMRDIFPAPLAENPRFLHAVGSWHTVLALSGSRIAVQRYISE